MTTHLATRAGILCHTEARWPARSGDLRDVTCRRCAGRLVSVAGHESEAAFDRNRLAVAGQAADELGAGFVWSLVLNGQTSSDRLMRDILAAVFVGLVEQRTATVEPAA